MITKQDCTDIEDECRRQNAMAPQQIIGMAAAYAIAREWYDDGIPRYASYTMWYEIIRRLGRTIEPEMAKSIRQTPVVFANGCMALPWDYVPHALNNLCVALQNGDMTPYEAYEEFETIHPYRDGNGRVGHILWKLVHVSTGLSWPDGCPPDLFSFYTNTIEVVNQ